MSVSSDSPVYLFGGLSLTLAPVTMVLVPTLLIVSFVVRMASAAKEWRDVSVGTRGEVAQRNTMRLVTTFALYVTVLVCVVASLWAYTSFNG